MQADSEQSSESGWRALYLAALFEANSAKLLERIAEAEYAINLRERELLYSGGHHTRETLALTGAMRALEALWAIHQYPCPRPAATPDPASFWRNGEICWVYGIESSGRGLGKTLAVRRMP
jgi:hypothetical protein